MAIPLFEKVIDRKRVGFVGEMPVEAVNALVGRSAHAILGSPDDRKLQSSLTLFERAAIHPEIFATALDRYYDGARDARTLEILGPG